MSIPIDEVLNWRGRAVVDRDGQKIGTFDEIYLDEGTSEPAWAAVKTGPFGFRRRVLPIAAAELNGDHVRVPFTKSDVKSAPSIDSEGWVAERDQAAILRHYGMSADQNRAEAESTPDTPEPESPTRLKLKRFTVSETQTREYGPE
jgi:hypothetical protein